MSTLTNEEAEKLLMLPKKIIVDDEPQNQYMLKSGSRLSERFFLRSVDGYHLFLLEIFQGKRRLKITLHFRRTHNLLAFYGWIIRERIKILLNAMNLSRILQSHMQNRILRKTISIFMYRDINHWRGPFRYVSANFP